MEKTAVYKNYTVNSDGEIFNEKGEKLRIRNGCVTIKDDAGTHIINAGRIILEAFGEEMNKHKVIIYKDGDKNNTRLENLSVKSRENYFRENTDLSKMKLFENEKAQKIAAEYHRSQQKKNPMTYIGMAKKYQCSIATISKVINGKY